MGLIEDLSMDLDRAKKVLSNAKIYAEQGNIAEAIKLCDLILKMKGNWEKYDDEKEFEEEVSQLQKQYEQEKRKDEILFEKCQEIIDTPLKKIKTQYNFDFRYLVDPDFYKIKFTINEITLSTNGELKTEMKDFLFDISPPNNIGKVLSGHDSDVYRLVLICLKTNNEYVDLADSPRLFKEEFDKISQILSTKYQYLNGVLFEKEWVENQIKKILTMKENIVLFGETLALSIKPDIQFKNRDLTFNTIITFNTKQEAQNFMKIFSNFGFKENEKIVYLSESKNEWFISQIPNINKLWTERKKIDNNCKNLSIFLSTKKSELRKQLEEIDKQISDCADMNNVTNEALEKTKLIN
jgi:hypothetical protein